MPQARIRVFWDLESCPPSPSYPGSHWDLLKDVRLFTSRFGVITGIKAYWDHNQTQNSQEGNVGKLRAAMPSMGINIVDCGLMEVYSRESLARTLIVDFMLSAIDDPVDIDKPGKDVIMIFSGNKSILHPISLLMFRGYTVILVVPDEVEDIEASRATRVFNWQADVLGLRHNQGLKSIPGTEHSRPRGSSLNATHAPQSIDMEASGPVPSPHSSTSTVFQVSPQTSLGNGVPSSMKSPHQHRSPVPLHPMSPIFFNTTVLPTATPKIKSKSIPAEPFESPGSRAPSVLSLHSETAASWIGHNPSENSGRSSDIRGQMLGQISPMPSEGQIGDTGSNQGIGSGWDPTSSSWSPELTTGFNITQLKTEPKQELPGTEHKCEPQPGNYTFEPLLQILRKAKAGGKPSVLRSQLGAVLNKDKEVYLAAGVISFSGYIALAAQKGLVDIGGTSGRDWVSLKS